MRIVLTLAVIAAVVALFRWLRMPDAPVRRRPTITEIFCLDCDRERARQAAGNGPILTAHYSRIPRRSFLTLDGRCDACGSKSHVLAGLYAPRWAAYVKSERARVELPAVVPEFTDARPEEDRYERR